MFRKALPEKLQEPVKTNRVLKPAQKPASNRPDNIRRPWARFDSKAIKHD
jgi:hypothetical protein